METTRPTMMRETVCAGSFANQYIIITGTSDYSGNINYSYYTSGTKIPVNQRSPEGSSALSKTSPPKSVAGSPLEKSRGKNLAKKVRTVMSKSAGYTAFTSPSLFRQLYGESLLPKDAADINPDAAMSSVRHLRRLCSNSYAEINHLRKVRKSQ